MFETFHNKKIIFRYLKVKYIYLDLDEYIFTYIYIYPYYVCAYVCMRVCVYISISINQLASCQARLSDDGLSSLLTTASEGATRDVLGCGEVILPAGQLLGVLRN